jgi:hypothetical protein
MARILRETIQKYDKYIPKLPRTRIGKGIFKRAPTVPCKVIGIAINTNPSATAPRDCCQFNPLARKAEAICQMETTKASDTQYAT